MLDTVRIIKRIDWPARAVVKGGTLSHLFGKIKVTGKSTPGAREDEEETRGSGSLRGTFCALVTLPSAYVCLFERERNRKNGGKRPRVPFEDVI